MPTTRTHLWGIILAGGDGRRLQPFIRVYLGSDRPKQYCTFFGSDSMLRQTIYRAERLIPPARPGLFPRRLLRDLARFQGQERPGLRVWA